MEQDIGCRAIEIVQVSDRLILSYSVSILSLEIKTVGRIRNNLRHRESNIHIFDQHFSRLLFYILRIRTASLSQGEHFSNLARPQSDSSRLSWTSPEAFMKSWLPFYLLAELCTACKAKPCFKKYLSSFENAVQTYYLQPHGPTVRMFSKPVGKAEILPQLPALHPGRSTRVCPWCECKQN